MRTEVKRGLAVSRMTLGTAQLGMAYGLRQGASAPDQSAAARLLSLSRGLGVTSLDTARAYGDAEEKIGGWITREGAGESVIVTKIHDLDLTDERALIDSMRRQVLAARRRLNLKCIPVVMLHHYEEYAACPAAMNRALDAMKREGLIRLGGVSAYASHDYRRIAESGLDAVQIPVNYLDQGQWISGGLRALEEADMLVFARSVYLQGLLLRTPETLEGRMGFARDTVARCAEAAGSFGLSQAQLALSFALSLPAVTSVVLGCRDEAQLRQNVGLVNGARPLSREQMERMRHWFADTPREISVPMLWPRD